MQGMSPPCSAGSQSISVCCTRPGQPLLTGGLDGDASVLLVLPCVCQPRIASLQEQRTAAT